MTFDQIVADICGRLNLVSDEAKARVGQAVNRHYRRVTASIGLEPVRYITRTAQTQLDSDRVTFTGIEKIDRVFEKAPDGRVLVLAPVLLAQIREGRESQGSRQRYAIWQQDATSITILLPGLALAITDLYADGWTVLADLVGADEPGIPSSFHDILIFSVVAEEQMRKEKPQLADRFSLQAETLLKELRFTLADAPAVELRQGDHVIDSAGGGGTGGSGSSVITGDIVFDRDPAPPFDVTAGSGMVENLDADKLDGQHGSFYQNASNLNAGTVPPAQIGPDSIGYDKLPNVNASKLLGRGGSAGPGDPEEINVGSGLAMVGMTLAALPQPPAAHAASHNAGGTDPITSISAAIVTQGTLDPARIAPDSISNDKLANLAPSLLLGRGSAATGDPEPIALGTGLVMTGTTLATVQQPAPPTAHAPTHNTGGADPLTALDAGILTTGILPAARIADHSVTLVKLPTSVPNQLLGRGNTGSGDLQPIVLGTGLSMVGTTLNAAGGSGGTGSPGGTDTQVQFNDAGVFGGALKALWDKVKNRLTITGDLVVQHDFANLRLIHPSAPANQRAWVVATSGDTLQMQTQDDADAFVAAPLSVARNGDTQVGGTLRVNGNATITGMAQINNQAYVASDFPLIALSCTADPVNNQSFWIENWGQQFRIAAFNDDRSAYQGGLAISRTGLVTVTRIATQLGTVVFNAGTGNLEWDLATGAAFRFAGASGNFGNVFLNPPPTGIEFVFSAQIDIIGPGAVTWPATVTWDEDVPPTFPAPGRTIILGFSTIDGGARWRGYVGGRNFAT